MKTKFNSRKGTHLPGKGEEVCFIPTGYDLKMAGDFLVNKCEEIKIPVLVADCIYEV
jgi:hypothetical protein